jgi:hypothetical protein
MIKVLAVAIFAIATPAIARAQVTIPPANGPQAAPNGPQATIGCGPSNINWDVTTDEKNHPTAAPDPAKAHLYLIQDDTEFVPHPRPSVRFGIDGQWVGATHSNSYFFVAVNPGEHLVCINWQGMVGAGGPHRESVLHLTAEPGTDYYFSAHDVFSGGGPGPGPHPNTQQFVVFTQINSDQAMLMMSRYAYATSTPKK